MSQRSRERFGAVGVPIVVALIATVMPLGGCDEPAVNRPLEGAPPVRQLPSGGQWLKNHAVTDMWSGPADQAGVISFGKTSTQFCVFQARDQRDGRVYVFNPYSDNYF